MSQSNRALGAVGAHLSKARLIEARARAHHNEGRFDESVMWAFYAAVHYVNARLRHVGHTWIPKHQDRDHLMVNDVELQKQVCYDSYRDLKEKSEDSRYGLRPMIERDSRASLAGLDAVRDAVLAALPAGT
jgi:hypothetical protein